MKTDLKVGDLVRHADNSGTWAEAAWPGRITSITPGKAYNGPRTGPYRVIPRPMLAYVVELSDKTVKRIAQVEGERCPLVLADA